MKDERKGLFHSIGTTFMGMWSKYEGLRLRSVRPSMLFYVLAYTFGGTLYSLQQIYLPAQTKLFGMNGFSVMYLGHMLFSLLIMLLWSQRFKYLIHISIALLLIGFFPFLFLPEGYLRLSFGIIAWIGLGGCITAARCGYAFAANNAERLVGVMITFSLLTVFQFLEAFSVSNLFFTGILPILLLAGLVISLLSFREKDLETKEQTTPADNRGLYWAFAYFVVYFAIDGYNWGLMDDGSFAGMVALGVGMLLAGVIFIAVLALFQKSIWHIWNLYFVFSIIMVIFAVSHPPIGTDMPQYFFSGASLIGWPAALYMLGCAQRRFASYKLLKQCTLVFVLLSPLTTLSDEVVGSLFPQYLPVVALVLILVVVIAFTMASPFSYKYLFSAAWIGDLSKQDMTLLQDKAKEADRFEQYRLTPREKEVLTLLLSANTGRMISGELKISQSAVNMHTSNLYKKMNVSSKMELLAKFGVAKKED